MAAIKAFLLSVDRNLLFILSTFLLVFIPLFPKIPLFDALPGYIVRVRPEDFLVFFTGLVWIRDIFLKRTRFNTSFFWFVCFYAAAGLLSILLGVVLLHTIPVELLHIGKSGLHFFRYLEYFSLFFFLFSAIKTKRQIAIVCGVLLMTVLGVVGYGVGQKYFHFPVYSTMNREYSKGEKLYLQEGARPQSTFAGHYDLAAFLVIVLPILFSLSLRHIQKKSLPSNIFLFAIFAFVHAAGLLMLVLSGSKTSLFGYMLGIGVVLLFHILRLPTRRLQLLVAGILLVCGSVGAAIGWVVLPQSYKEKVTKMLPMGQASDRPVDLIGDGYEERLTQQISSDGKITYEMVRTKSTWSENALKYGLSMGIRLDTLWPQALLGLARNPLNGAGYGTLAMLDTQGFVEADSTDNNFLRTLGETGILGFVTFYGVVVLILLETVKAYKGKSTFISSLSIGFTGSIIGLLVAAIYLDVFAASKVAFTFWALAGIVIKAIFIEKSVKLQNTAWLQAFHTFRKHIQKHWPVYVILISAFFLFHQNPYMQNNPTKDLDPHTGPLEQLTAARCFLAGKSFTLCRENGLVSTPHVSLYALLLLPFLSIFQPVGVFTYLTLLSLLAILVVSYVWLQKRLMPIQSFSVLALALFVMSLFIKSAIPLTDMQLLLLIGVGIISTIIGLKLFKLSFLRTQPVQLGIGILCVVLLSLRMVQSDIFLRFQNKAYSYGYQALQIANGNIHTQNRPTYLMTSHNPYYADLYALDKFAVLPLASSQPYANIRENVWGVSKTQSLFESYDELLQKNAKLYATDYQAQENQLYAKDFDNLKKAYDLSYVALGCEENCNLYQVEQAVPPVSLNPVSSVNGRTLYVNQVRAPYTFGILTHRFDPPISNIPLQPSNPYTFVQKLSVIQNQQIDFLIFTGDLSDKNEKVHADIFTDGFSDLVKYPILYNPGNYDEIPKKYFEGGFQTFFTNTEFFIFLDVDAKSEVDLAQRLELYTAFLQVEKMEGIQNIFIIAHELNWLDTANPNNILHAIERKTSKLTSKNIYIVSANHKLYEGNPDQPWFVSTQKGNITYVASMMAEHDNDLFLQVTIDATGQAAIQPIPFQDLSTKRK